MAATLRVTSLFLNNLKSLFPEAANRVAVESSASTSTTKSPWYIVAAVAFSASNKPDAVPRVFERALQDLRSQSALKSEEILLAQKLREALFNIFVDEWNGLKRQAINGLKALHEVMPEDLQDKKIQRDTTASFANYESSGATLFKSVYGEKAESVQSLLDCIYPDMGWFSKTIGYGLVYGGKETLTALETSYTLVAALIAGDTPQQIAWHLDGARREGGSLDEVRAVRELSMEVAKFAGIQWVHSVPEVSDE